jgi:Transposase DDE domain
MLLSSILDRFAKRAPISVMVRASLEYALEPAAVDALFRDTAEQQREKTLLFSSVVDLMGLVVARVQPSLNAAYQAVSDTLPVSITSVYNKINGTEPTVSAALVAHSATRLRPVIDAMASGLEPWLPGYRVRVLDGNHLTSTERRLDVLRECSAGPLPGQALVVLQPDVMLATHMLPCEDAHAQERSLTPDVLALVEAGDCWVADRNFCTFALLNGFATRQAFFAIRHHAKLRIISSGTLRRRGRTETGEVFEQKITIEGEDGTRLKARRILLRLDAPTRDGETELAVVTNVPAKDASAVAIAELYRKRWTLETMFFELTQMLDGELNTMGYPRAALLGFGLALVSYNLLSVARSALRAAFGAKKVDEEVSSYYIANEARVMSEGLDVATDPNDWIPFQTMSAERLAEELVKLARNVRLSAFKRHKRGPKKPVPKRTKHTDTPHVSTARLLTRAKGKVTP